MAGTDRFEVYDRPSPKCAPTRPKRRAPQPRSVLECRQTANLCSQTGRRALSELDVVQLPTLQRVCSAPARIARAAACSRRPPLLVSYVPSHACEWGRIVISAANFPHGRSRTPRKVDRYCGALPLAALPKPSPSPSSPVRCRLGALPLRPASAAGPSGGRAGRGVPGFAFPEKWKMVFPAPRAGEERVLRPPPQPRVEDVLAPGSDPRRPGLPAAWLSPPLAFLPFFCFFPFFKPFLPNLS